MCTTFSATAARFMARMVRMNGGPAGSGFRLVVAPGGCSGFDTQFTVEAAPLPGDELLIAEGVRVFVPAASRELLEGYTVDFSETPTNSGFTYHNPNKSACMCSSSAVAARPAATVSVSSIGRRHP